MMSISILVVILTYVDAELCRIRTANDLANAKNCTELELYANDEVIKSPLLFDKIKMATTYRHFELNGTELEKNSEAKEVLLPKGSIVTILDNFNLRELPKFNIVDANAIKLSVIGNPKLDTKQLLMECEKKNCSQETLNSIQVPFSCRAITPMPTTCRIVFGTLPLHLYDYSWGTMQKLYGTITLENSQLKRVLKPEMLEQVIQLKNTPVLVVKNNSKLEDIDPLLDLNYVINDDKGVDPVQIQKNSKLCIDVNHAANPFVTRYLKNVTRCYRHRMAEVSDRKTREIQEAGMESSIGHKEGPTDSTHGNTEAGGLKLDTNMEDRNLPVTMVDQSVDQNGNERSASEVPKVETNRTFVVTTKAKIKQTAESVRTKKSGGLKEFFRSLFPCCF